MAGHTSWSEIKKRRPAGPGVEGRREAVRRELERDIAIYGAAAGDYRLSLYFPAVGKPEEESVGLLEAFAALHPEVGPVTESNLETRTVGVTFSLEAEDAADAWARGAEVLDDGASGAGFSARPLLGIEIAKVDDG